MDLKSTIDIILKDLEEARSIMDDLKTYPDVPVIQIELAKAKCRSAEEVLKFIGEMNLSHPEKDIAPISDSESKSEIVQEERSTQDLLQNENVEIFEINDLEKEIAETKLDENDNTKADTDSPILDQIVQAEQNDPKAPVEVKGQKGQILADKFTKQSSINESVANKRHDDEHAEVSNLKPVNDLSTAIGINDRFQFVRNLFNDNRELYNQTISRLNKATSVDEAFDILTESSQSKSDSETFDQLLDLVKRKLTKH